MGWSSLGDYERFGDCSADIVLATSRDGVRWFKPTRIPTGPFEGFTFPCAGRRPGHFRLKARLAPLPPMSPSVARPDGGMPGIDAMVTDERRPVMDAREG
jgi:hypothetical protein